MLPANDHVGANRTDPLQPINSSRDCEVASEEFIWDRSLGGWEHRDDPFLSPETQAAASCGRRHGCVGAASLQTNAGKHGLTGADRRCVVSAPAVPDLMNIISPDRGCISCVINTVDTEIKE